MLTNTIVREGASMGGHAMVNTLLPRAMPGSLLRLEFDPSTEYPERISIFKQGG